MSIGFFGGTFNPVHKGHLRLADYLQRSCGLDEVWLSLSPQNPLKSQTHEGASDADRLRMLQLACEDFPSLKAWDGELEMPRPSYSFHVLERLRTEGLDPVLIIGADNWLKFNQWFNYEQILADYKVIVYPRPGVVSPSDSGYGNVIFADNAPQTDISSTEIRNDIINNLHWLPEPVAEYIMKKHLYGYKPTFK